MGIVIVRLLLLCFWRKWQTIWHAAGVGAITGALTFVAPLIVQLPLAASSTMRARRISRGLLDLDLTTRANSACSSLVNTISGTTRIPNLLARSAVGQHQRETLSSLKIDHGAFLVPFSSSKGFCKSRTRPFLLTTGPCQVIPIPCRHWCRTRPGRKCIAAQARWHATAFGKTPTL